MKKISLIIISLFLLSCLVTFLVFPDYTKTTITEVLTLWLTKVLVSLVPFYLVSNLLVQFPFVSKILYFPLNKIMHFENQKACSLFLLSFITGNPTSSFLIITSIDQGISKQEGMRLLKGAVLNSPLFTIVMMPKPYGYLVYFIQVFVSIFLYIINKPKQEIALAQANKTNISSIITIIDNCPNVMLSILGSMLFVSTIKIPLYLLISKGSTIINNTIITTIFYFFLDSFELTTGLSNIMTYNVSLFVKLLLCAFLMSFGGIAINVQIMSELKKTSFQKTSLLVPRLIHGLITALIFGLVIVIFFH